MPEFKEYYINDSNFNNVSHISEWYDVRTIKNIVLTVYCSSNCDIIIDYATDTNYTVILTEIDSVIANSATTMHTTVKTRYIRFTVNNIAIQPSLLIAQALYN